MIRQGAMAFALACTTTQAMAGITWGVNGHPITAYPGIPIADQLDLVSDLGPVLTPGGPDLERDSERRRRQRPHSVAMIPPAAQSTGDRGDPVVALLRSSEFAAPGGTRIE